MKDENQTIEKVEEELATEEQNAETAEESTEESTAVETADSEAEESSEEAPSEKSEVDMDLHIQNLKKNDAAKLLVKKATIIVNESEAQLQECRLLLESDLKGYESAKEALKENGLDASESLLESLGYPAESSAADEDLVVFEPKEEIAPIHIKNVSSGAFTGFIMALVFGLGTLLGMVYVATEKLGITLDLSKVPGPETMDPILKWYSAAIGLPGSTTIGTTVIAVAVLLVMWIVYKIRVSLKAAANVRMAKAQLLEAEAYSEKKGSCKQEMDKVDAYINEAIETLKLYQVILNEQKGKLERILHIEKEKVVDSDFHHKSLAEINDTQELVVAIKDFMSVPMSEEGKLSGKSSLFLHRAKSKIQKVLDRLY